MSGQILVAVSGGQSSAVTAAVLRSQGHPLIAVYFEVCDPKKPMDQRFGARCCLRKSRAAAEAVCKKLDIPLHVIELSGRFQDRVEDDFVHQVLQARRPLACVPCNIDIRFAALFEKADALGCEQVATGHHAQVLMDAPRGDRPPLARLLRAVSVDRDQSYFLFGLKQDQLRRLMLPLGGFQDSMISRLAVQFELPESGDPDVQIPCFLKGTQYLDYVRDRSAESLRPFGVIKLRNGNVVGDHRGIYAHPIGSEPKLHASIKEKYVVVGYDNPTHSLIVGGADELIHKEARAHHAKWVRPLDGLRGMLASARLWPTHHVDIPCRIIPFENDTVRIEFKEPMPGLEPGAPIVFYDQDEVLGGAWIEQSGGE